MKGNTIKITSRQPKTTEIYPAQFYPALLNGTWIHCARVYTHVSNRALKKIKSPLDNIKVDKGDL